jgi:hypothetical protein
MTRRKKVILTIIVLAVTGGGAYWYFFLRGAGGPPEASQQFGFLPQSINNLLNRRPATSPKLSPKPSAPTMAERQKQKLYRISNEPALAPVVRGDKLYYFTKANGFLWESDMEGLEQKKDSDTQVDNLVEAAWSRTGDKAILGAADSAGVMRRYIYTATERQPRPLDANMRSVAFSPKGDRIIYHRVDTVGGDRAIVIANADGTSPKILLHPIFNDFTLAWPREETAVIETKPSFASLTHLHGLDTRTGYLTKVLPEDFAGLDAAWSPSGTKLFCTRATEEGDAAASFVATWPQSVTKEVFGAGTLAEKCAWKRDGNSVICGAPTEIPYGTRLPDDYFSGVFVSVDNVVEISLPNASARTIALAQGMFPTIDIDTPIFSSDETKLFFVNRRDGYIYAMRL